MKQKAIFVDFETQVKLMEDEIKGMMAEKFALRGISKDVLAKRKEMDAVIKQLRADRLQLLELAGSGV
jgi:hypothetical protein